VIFIYINELVSLGYLFIIYFLSQAFALPSAVCVVFVFNIYFFEQQHKIIRLYELFVLLFNNIFVFPIF